MLYNLYSAALFKTKEELISQTGSTLHDLLTHTPFYSQTVLEGERRRDLKTTNTTTSPLMYVVCSRETDKTQHTRKNLSNIASATEHTTCC